MSCRVHFFQHVPYEDPGYILDWCNRNDVRVSFTRFYENEPVPEPGNFDCLVVMGGPMGVYDEKEFPWLSAEKEIIASAIKNNIPVLGICLGAQLLATVLGAPVYKNSEKEIGWFDIYFTQLEHMPSFFKNRQSQSMKVFHWHGDTFDLPENAILLATSEACKNQAFLYGDRVIGLQFHFEVTEASLESMIGYGRNELVKGRYIQDPVEILHHKYLIPEINRVMGAVMEWMIGMPAGRNMGRIHSP